MRGGDGYSTGRRGARRPFGRAGRLLGLALLALLALLAAGGRLGTVAASGDRLAPSGVAANVVHQLGGEVSDALLLGQRLFVAVERRVLAVDVGPPGPPRVVALTDTLPGHVHDLVAARGRLLAATEAGLLVIDPTGAERLAVTAALLASSQPLALAVDGRFVYVAVLDGGPIVVDLRMPDRPRVVGRLPETWATGLVLTDHALGVWSTDTLYVYDRMEPARPLLRAVHRPPEGMYRAAATLGDHAFLARELPDQTLALDVFDTAGPAARLVAELQPGPRFTSPTSLAADPAARRLYLLGGIPGIAAFDLGDPASPALRATSDNTFGTALAVDGERLMVLDAGWLHELVLGDDGSTGSWRSTEHVAPVAGPLAFVDGRVISGHGSRRVGAPPGSVAGQLGPGLPRIGSPLAQTGSFILAQRLVRRTAGRELYEWRLMDLTDADAPRLRGVIGPTAAAAAAGGYIVTADDGHTLRVIDIADPDQPRVIGQLALPIAFDCIIDIALVERRAAVAVCGSQGDLFYDAGQLALVDLSDLRAPRYLGALDLPHTATSVDAADGLAVVGRASLDVEVDGPTVIVADVGGDGPPTGLSSWTDPSRRWGADVLLRDGIAYVGLWRPPACGLRALDLRQPDRSRELPALPGCAGFGGLTWGQDTLWAAGEQGLWGFRDAAGAMPPPNQAEGTAQPGRGNPWR